MKPMREDFRREFAALLDDIAQSIGRFEREWGVKILGTLRDHDFAHMDGEWLNWTAQFNDWDEDDDGDSP